MEIKKIGINNKPEIIELKNKSLLCMSRMSQEVFQHSIPLTEKCTGQRFSLTFRNIAPFHRNSTLIIGDSNTEKLVFTKEGFGTWMPGKRIPCMLADKIPDPEDIAPYRNIFIHVGINNVKFKDAYSVRKTVNIIKEKTQHIADSFRSSKVYLCPLLPSKDIEKRNNIIELNKGITEIARKSSNILLMPNYFSNFAGEDGLLKETVGRWRNGNPSSDDLHLGRKGICLLAKCLKHVVLNRKGPITRYGQTNTDSAGSSNLYRQQHGASKITNSLLPLPPTANTNLHFNGDYQKAMWNDHRNKYFHQI